NGGTTDQTGGQWFYTINGQVFPNVPVKSETGEIWRITNASGGNTYELGINDAPNHDMIFQVLSVDGVSIVNPTGGSQSAIQSLLSSAALQPAKPARGGCAWRGTTVQDSSV